MFVKTACALLSVAVMFLLVGFHNSVTQQEGSPQYTTEGKLKFPENYREWVYITSGFDMSYNPHATASEHMFDTVFVNPEAYQVFKQTGLWPDKTVLMLENRRATGLGSINQSGHYQSQELMGLEAHVKDATRFSGKWAFFAFGGNKDAKMIPQTEDCYSCHRQHAAVDTTFVQFYPTRLPLAESKGTLSATYFKELESPQK